MTRWPCWPTWVSARLTCSATSLGAGIALNIITNHPTVVRKAVLASVTYDKTGLHPEIFGGPESGEPAYAPGHDVQIPLEQEYRALAPQPGNRPALLAKVQAMELPEITPQAISAINVPILLIIGDSDIVTPEHAVAMFRLLGGGVPVTWRPCPAPSSPSCRTPRTSGSAAAPTCS
jgi:pimeloyl-ACP methyl ester carboxylesterase